MPVDKVSAAGAQCYGNRGYLVIDLTVATNVIKYIITYNIKVKIIKKE